MEKYNYKIKLHMNGMDYLGQGETMESAFNNLDINYLTPKTKGEITVTYKKNEAVRLFQLGELRRILASKIRRSGIIRDLERLLV